MVSVKRKILTSLIALGVSLWSLESRAIDNSFVARVNSLSKQKDLRQRLREGRARVVEIVVDAQTTFFQLVSNEKVCAGRVQIDPQNGTETYLEDNCKANEVVGMRSESAEVLSADSKDLNSPDQDLRKMKSAAEFVQGSSAYLGVERVTAVRFESHFTIVSYRSPGKGTCQVALFSMKLQNHFNFNFKDPTPICHIQ